MKTWPLQPALAYLNALGYTDSDIRHRALNMSAVQWNQWRNRLHTYRLTDERADFIAIELVGQHPCLIWSDWCDNLQTELFEDQLDEAA